MPGVRLHHPEHRNGTYVVPIHSLPLSVPFECQTCNRIHSVKNFHLKLDENGDIIVSTQIVERLKGIGMAGFMILNEVITPPDQVLDFNPRPPEPRPLPIYQRSNE